MKQKTRRTIENRRRVNEFMEACAGVLPVPVLTVTCGGNVLSMNPAARQLFGIPDGDAGTPVLDDLLLRGDGCESAIEESCRKQNPVSGMVKIRSSSGPRDLNCTVVPFMGEDGAVLLVTLLFSDMTGNGGRSHEGSAGNLVSKQPGSDFPENLNEWEEVLLAFSRGDLRTFPPSGVQDPLFRLKYLYNEGIAAVQKMVSVKDLFGG